jgi:hypothetical protein
VSSPDPLERHFQDFGRELRLASARERAARRTRRIGSLAGAIAAAGLAATVLVAVLPRGGVGDAKGGHGTGGAIIHYVVSSGRVTSTIDGHTTRQARACIEGDREVWARTSGPPRWRAIYPAPARDRSCGITMDADGRIETGRTQEAVDGDRVTNYSPSLGQIRITTDVHEDLGYSPDILPSLAYGDFVDRDRDLVGSIGSMLHDGRVVVTGHGTKDGRATLTLVGEDQRDAGDGTAQSTTTYVVDAKTYDPITMDFTLRYTPDEDLQAVETQSSSVRFKAFERLPATAANLALLQVRPAGPVADVESHTAAEWQAITRRKMQADRP